MVKVTYVAHDGAETPADVAVGSTLMEGAVENGFDGIKAVCGGNCYCGTCRVYVTADWMEKLAPASEDELAMIESSGDENPNARLACQIPVSDALDGIRVITPEFQQ